jgi:hypothetical protein
MAFADPQVWDVNAVAKSMPRVGQGINVGDFRTDDGIFSVHVQHAYGKRTRSVIRLTQTKIAADPFDASLNQQVSMTVSLIVDKPVQGFTIVEQGYVVKAMLDELAASSAALTTKFLGGES